jgi:hypothetical protein
MDWTGLLDGMTGVVRDTFGDPVSYYRAETGTTHTTTPSGAPLTAVFDVESIDSKDGASLTASNRRTVIDIRLADLGFVPAKNDEATVRGTTYFVMDKDPSSSGNMKLQLRKKG